MDKIARDGGVQAVLFDLGSTLIYFDADWPAVLDEANTALTATLRQAVVDLDEPQFTRDFRQALEAYYRERDTEFIEYTTQFVLQSTLEKWGYRDVPEPVLCSALNAMYAISQRHWRLEVDAVPTLNRLKEMGYRLGLISNAGDDQDVQTLVDNSGLRDYFDVIVSSAALGIRKPNPRIFQMILEQLGAQPERAVMVGDTLGADILGARNAGMISIWIKRRADTPQNQAHIDTITPDYVVDDLAEIPGIIDSIQRRKS